MKINGFEVEHALDMGEDGVIRGWWQTPSKPHVTYRVEISRDDIEFPDDGVEEIEITDAVQPDEQVQMPDNSVQPVLPADVTSGDAAAPTAPDAQE